MSSNDEIECKYFIKDLIEMMVNYDTEPFVRAIHNTKCKDLFPALKTLDNLHQTHLTKEVHQRVINNDTKYGDGYKLSCMRDCTKNLTRALIYNTVPLHSRVFNYIKHDLNFVEGLLYFTLANGAIMMGYSGAIVRMAKKGW